MKTLKTFLKEAADIVFTKDDAENIAEIVAQDLSPQDMKVPSKVTNAIYMFLDDVPGLEQDAAKKKACAMVLDSIKKQKLNEEWIDQSKQKTVLDAALKTIKPSEKNDERAVLGKLIDAYEKQAGQQMPMSRDYVKTFVKILNAYNKVAKTDIKFNHPYAK